MNNDNNQTISDVLNKRPLNVLQACILQILTALMTAVTTFNGYEHYVEMAKQLNREPGSIEQFYFSRIISITIAVVLAYFFYKGKNWARIVFIVFFIITCALQVNIDFNIILQNITEINTIISLFQIVISLAICCLLLTNESRNWFREVKLAYEEAYRDDNE